MNRGSFSKMRPPRGNKNINNHNISPADCAEKSCGFSSLISLNNTSYYNQSSDPQTVPVNNLQAKFTESSPVINPPQKPEVLTSHAA